MATNYEADTSVRAPNPNNPDPLARRGDIESAILSKDGPVPDNLNKDRIDDEDDIVTNNRRTRPVIEETKDEDEEDEVNGDGDLFGDDDEDDQVQRSKSSKRHVDDEELDSGDDVDRLDRVGSRSPQQEVEQRDQIVEYSDLARQYGPEPSDGEMYLLKMPKFLAIEPIMFDQDLFAIPTKELHSREEPSPDFSAYNTAMSTIRWRYSPSNPKEMQSNARILRWSDGSFSLQLGSDPLQQYEIDGNALAPPQRKPRIPTPTSSKPFTTAETYTYLTVPHETAGLLRVTHKITSGLSILPSQKTTDDALERLQSSLAAAVRGKNTSTNSSAIEILPVGEDPELGRKKAELAEKEKQRAQKRRDAAELRDGGRGYKQPVTTMRRYGGGGGGGLTADDLENDDEDDGENTNRAAKKVSRASRPRRGRNDEYDSDEDMGRRRGNFANDDYEVDDFVAGSDEEEEVVEDDNDDDEEEEVEEEIDDRGKSGGERGEKRKAADVVENEDGEEDAEGEPDDEGAASRSNSMPKSKKRRAVLDDDEDE